MELHEVNRAINEARATLRRADSVAGDVAWLLVGRLRNVTSSLALAALKRELRDYNINTGWKDSQ